jgi:23S rRNA (cytosine1962-C5)-methyltransferase
VTAAITVTPKGVGRLRTGHPWVFRSDVRGEADVPAGLVALADERGKALGTALYSPHSEIRARWLAAPGTTVDAAWWRAMVAAALGRRAAIADSGYRAVHAEGDGLPSLVVDRYGAVAVAQLLSAGLEAVRDDVLTAVRDVLAPAGLLLRNDAPVRERERLPRGVELAFGDVPEAVEYQAGGMTWIARPWSGQKTGAFLDQRENHGLVGSMVRPGTRCLDVFSYHGGFGLHMAKAGGRVSAVDSSPEALAQLRLNAQRNGLDVDCIEANAFDWLRGAAQPRGGERFGAIVLDPPAFARDRRSVPRALAGYKELNLRAMQLLEPDGVLFTASCSFHVHRGDFFAMLADAASDAGRRMALVEIRGAAADHPELLTVPETGYLKAALLRAAD